MKVSSIWGGTGFECRLVLEVCSSCSEYSPVQFSSVGQSCPTLWPHGLQHARPPCPSPTPGVYTDSCPLSWWCHPAISSSVIPFSSHLQSFPASGSFPMSQFFASGGQSIGVSASASVLPMNIQDWSPLGWTGWNSLQSKGLSRVFSNTTQFKSVNSTCIQWDITQPQKWNNVIWSYTDGPRDGHTKRCQTERQMSYDTTYTWNLSDTLGLVYQTEIESQA